MKAETPTCNDCSVPMIAAKGYHAILAFRPPQDLDPHEFSPVSLYVCGSCGQVRFYLAQRSTWLPQRVEEVAYRYSVNG